MLSRDALADPPSALVTTTFQLSVNMPSVDVRSHEVMVPREAVHFLSRLRTRASSALSSTPTSGTARFLRPGSSGALGTWAIALASRTTAPPSVRTRTSEPIRNDIGGLPPNSTAPSRAAPSFHSSRYTTSVVLSLNRARMPVTIAVAGSPLAASRSAAS